MDEYQKNHSGFTLIETIVYLALMAIVVSGYISFALSMSALRQKMYIIQEVQANSRVSMNIMSQKIRSAANIVEPAVIGATSSVLILDMAGTGISTSTFSLIDDMLYLTNDLGTPINLTSRQIRIENLVFTKLSESGDRANIGVEMLVKNKFGESDEYKFEQAVNTSVSLRR